MSAKPRFPDTGPAPFGRSRDDRNPLLFAAAAAVALHVAAVFIPLPRVMEPQIPPSDPTPVRITRTMLPPPDRPEPPPDDVPPPADRLEWLPFPEAPDPGPTDEPDASEKTPFDTPDAPLDMPLGQVQAPPPPADELVDADTLGLVLPVGIYLPQPDFPEPARQSRRPGRVSLRAVVDREGRVRDIEVLWVTRPDLGYSQAAIAAVSTWRYRPGQIDGRIVDVRLTVNVEFELR